MNDKKRQNIDNIRDSENKSYQRQKQNMSFESSKKTFQSSQSMGAYDLKSVIMPRMIRQVTALVPDLKLHQNRSGSVQDPKIYFPQQALASDTKAAEDSSIVSGNLYYNQVSHRATQQDRKEQADSRREMNEHQRRLNSDIIK